MITRKPAESWAKKLPDLKSRPCCYACPALCHREKIFRFSQSRVSNLRRILRNDYERRLDLLKKWGDAYVSLIMTTALVTVMSVVSMMIGNVHNNFHSGVIYSHHRGIIHWDLVFIQDSSAGIKKSL
jgi:hypothetical protein